MLLLWYILFNHLKSRKSKKTIITGNNYLYNRLTKIILSKRIKTQTKLMTSILVTGCAGFIGSHLTELLLSKGYRVIGIDNFDPFYDKKIKEKNLQKYLAHPNFIFQEINIQNFDQLIAIQDKIDVVIHLAAKAGVLPSIKQSDDYILTNILGTRNILEMMKAKSIYKMLFASSSSIYGNNKSIPFTENQLVDEPISPYAYTKKSCELMNYTYHHLHNFDIINLRFFTVFGPRQRPDLAIHKFVKLIDENKSITMYGDGSTARDYTFVSDTVQGIYNAFKYIIENRHIYEIINLGNNHPVTLENLIQSIYELMGKKPNISRLPMQAGDVDITYADISKAQKILSYSPSTTLRDGLVSFIEWYHGAKN